MNPEAYQRQVDAAFRLAAHVGEPLSAFLVNHPNVRAMCKEAARVLEDLHLAWIVRVAEVELEEIQRRLRYSLQDAANPLDNLSDQELADWQKEFLVPPYSQGYNHGMEPAEATDAVDSILPDVAKDQLQAMAYRFGDPVRVFHNPSHPTRKFVLAYRSENLFLTRPELHAAIVAGEFVEIFVAPAKA